MVVVPLNPELEPAHGPVEVVELQPHLRNEVLHAADRVDDLDGLSVGVVPHLHRSAHVLGHPAPEMVLFKWSFKFYGNGSSS